MKIKTVIVDDEALARERLSHMLQAYAEIEVIGEVSNGMEAIGQIKTLQPDLVFLDIEMPGLNGFKVVQALDVEVLPKIIFVTAYNQYAIEAFEIGAIDYLLKPVKKSRLAQALKRVGSLIQEPRHDLVIAREVQRRLLPEKDLQLGNLELAGACLARNEVGGDYYDFMSLPPERLGVCVADISGKGFSAALMMANLQAMLRILSKEHREPATLITAVNKSFYENSIAEMYATLFYGIYDTSRGGFSFCNAGHNPPLLFQRKNLRRLDCGGTIVGMFADSRYHQETVSLDPGDLIVIYSDGLTELGNELGEEFGEKRLINLLEGHLHLPSSEIKELVLEEANRFSHNGAWQDDVTLVIMKVKNDAKIRYD